MTQPLLELSTLVPERPFIRVDGLPYDLRTSGDLGLVEIAQVTRLEARSRALMAEADPSADVALEAARLLREAVRVVLMAPAEVVDRLNDTQCLAVLTSFTQTIQLPAMDRTAKRRAPSTSGRSSPGSLASTATTAG